MDYPKINVMDTIKDGFQLAIKNVLPLILLVILYVITVWIPYLNVGTTIGLYKAVIAMSRGEVVDPVSIFDKENFKFFGNFFLLMGFMSMGITAATAFMFVPGIILHTNEFLNALHNVEKITKHNNYKRYVEITMLFVFP